MEGGIELGFNRKRKRAKFRKSRKQRPSADSRETQEEKDSNLYKLDSIDDGGDDGDESPAPAASAAMAKRAKRAKPSSFLEKMRAKLSGGHFRMINEKLYTCTGREALDYFKEDPSLFNVYHTGYQEQMAHWPEQPVNIIIKWLQNRSASLVVADFGCGDARLAKNVKNKVFSFDLVSNDPSVVACDMSNVTIHQSRRDHHVLNFAENGTPLDSSSIDVAVFCLSLMGTNFASYLQEAHRVLKTCGWLLIAEVKSRFDPNTGGADPNQFIKAVCNLGFSTVTKDFSNKMFILLYFKKKENQSQKIDKIRWPDLKPCLYKRR